MADAASTEALLTRLAALGEGDFFALAATTGHGTAGVATTRGSPNDTLCSLLAQQGWMTCHTQDAEGAGHRRYEITPAGHHPIGQLLALHAGRRFRDPALRRAPAANDAMTAIVNTTARSYVDALLRQILTGGGDAGDVSVMLVFTVARCLAMSVPPGQREAVAHTLFENVVRQLGAGEPAPARKPMLH